MPTVPNQRLVAAGRRLTRIVRALLLAAVASVVWVLLTKGPLGLLKVPREIEVSHGSIGLFRSLVIVVFGLARPSAHVLVLIYLHRLFDLYAHGIVFSGENSAAIRMAGYWLMAVDAVNVLVSALTGPLLTLLHITPGFFSIDLQSSMLVIGLFIVLVSRVMDMARELHERDQLTI